MPEEEARNFQEKISSLIKEGGGVLYGENLLLKKRLAYPIKKQNQAYLAVLNFQLNAEKLTDLEKKLKEDLQILRYLLLVKAKPEKIRIVPRRVVKEVISEKEKKVELKEIEKKLEEILKE